MKKNLILAIAGVLAVQISMAQTQKGAQTLGGYFSLTKGINNSSQIDAFSNQVVMQKNNSTNFGIGPVYSIFLADNLELRGALQFTSASNRSTYTGPYPNDVKQTSTNFGGSFSIMKYFMYSKLGLRVGPYAGYSRGVLKEINYVSTFNSTSHVNSYSAGAKADLVYYPSKSLGFAASLANLGYQKNKTQDKSVPQKNSSEEYFNANFITNGLGLSVFYVFGKK